MLKAFLILFASLWRLWMCLAAVGHGRSPVQLENCLWYLKGSFINLLKQPFGRLVACFGMFFAFLLRALLYFPQYDYRYFSYCKTGHRILKGKNSLNLLLYHSEGLVQEWENWPPFQSQLCSAVRLIRDSQGMTFRKLCSRAILNK